MSVKRKSGLGRGLSALLSDDSPVMVGDSELSSSDRHLMPIEHIERNVKQPRQHFDEESIVELSASIREKGLLQPILVRKIGNQRYEIVAGERRWRASQLAGVHEVPVVVKELNDEEVLEIAIIENVQRQDLNPVEEAKGYHHLINDFGHTQEEVSKVVGKSRSHVANLLRLLSLPKQVIKYIDEGKLSMGHARAIIGSKDPVMLAKKVISSGLNVRQTELLAGSVKSTKKHSSKRTVSRGKDADTAALEKDLMAALGGMKTVIDHRGEGGSISITYRTLDELDDLCGKLGVCGL